MKLPTRTPTTMPIVVFVLAATSRLHVAVVVPIRDKTYEFEAGDGTVRMESRRKGVAERDTAGIYIRYDGYVE